MITLNDNCFYHVGAWMRTKLNLKGVALEIFAIIYGFSQDGESKFTGSINYLCEWTGVSRPTVINTLKSLVDDDLIIKETETINGVTFNRYKANISYIVNLTGSKESLLGGSKNSLHNNDSIYNNSSHTSSKDDVLERAEPTTSEKPQSHSGKLFDTKKTPKKSSVQKTNAFITMCERVSAKFNFSQELLKELGNYFRMLGASGSLLPEQSIEEQMKILASVRERDRVGVVKDTVGHGWKSLQYLAKEYMEESTPSWDTARPDAFRAKTMEEKRRNPLEGVPEEDIF